MVEGGPMVECPRPGTIHISPVGRDYYLCEYHAWRFEQDVFPVAEACNITPPETGSDVQQFDGCQEG